MIELEVFRPSRNTGSSFYRFHHQGFDGLVKCYEGTDAQWRYKREKSLLTHWRRHGFRVPVCYEQYHFELNAPYLVMEFLPGRVFADILKAGATPDVFAMISHLFQESAERHALAMEKQDPNLLHSDMNLDNVIWCDKKCYFIDFEHEGKPKPLETQMAHEITTMCRRILRIMGRRHLRQVMMLLTQSYKDHPIILQHVLDKSYPKWSALTDALRSMFKKDDVVSKYDVVKELAKCMRQSSV